jgi:hypothetical protein
LQKLSFSYQYFQFIEWFLKGGASGDSYVLTVFGLGETLDSFAADQAKQNCYDRYDQENMNESAGTEAYESDGPEDDQDNGKYIQ